MLSRRCWRRARPRPSTGRRSRSRHCRRLTLSLTTRPSDRTRSWMLRTPRSVRASRGSARCHRHRARDLTMWAARSRRELVPPKVLEAVGRHFGVPDRVLNVLVPEVVLQGPRVMAIVSELEPTSMAKHVRVNREWHLGGLPEALDEAVETDGADWSAALGNEYVGVFRVIAT